MQNPLPKPQRTQKVKTHAQLQKGKTRAPANSNGRNYGKKDLRSRPPIPPYSNSKERISNGLEVTPQKPAPVFDLNQNARTYTGKDGTAPMLDLNQMDRIQSGNEATKKSITPFFDLNQISVIIVHTGVRIMDCLSYMSLKLIINSICFAERRGGNAGQC